MTWAGATVGGWLEGKSGFRGSVPWGTGQSLWALVNRSANKNDRRNLEKPGASQLMKLLQASPETGTLSDAFKSIN